MVKRQKLDQLSLFCFTWALANVFHIFSFPDRLVISNVFTWLNLVLAALVILMPRAVYLFALMLACSIVKTFQWMPFIPNHILFEWLINLGMLLTIVVFFRRHRHKSLGGFVRSEEGRNQLFNHFAPFVRVSLLVLYFYTVVHKLNWDYFNPDISCGPDLLVRFGDRLPQFMTQSVLIRLLALWGTLLIEIAIPVFFLFRRTRIAGVILGLVFHFFLSFHPHPGLYSFSSLLFSLFCLFLPKDFTEKATALAADILGHTRVNSIIAFIRIVASFSILTLTGVFLSGIFPVFYPNKLGLILWLCVSVFGMLFFAGVVIKYKLHNEEFRSFYGVRSPAYLVVPLFVFVNGSCPYLGLKTQTSFSMFSNLRTEGGYTNHLFLPVSLHLTNLEEDLVDIVKTDDEELGLYHRSGQLITFFELHRIASTRKKDFFVDFIRHGHLEELVVKHGVSSIPALTDPIPLLQAKFICFRPVDKGPCLCKH